MATSDERPGRPPTELTFEEARDWLFDHGYDHIEVELTPNWVAVMAWRSFNRPDGLATGEATLDDAISKLVERVKHRDGFDVDA